MYTIDFNNLIHVHFIGIGGISMSGLALILKDRGFTVTGSDMKRSDQTALLTEKGIEVSFPQKASNITEGTDLVVYTAAISRDNPEFLEVLRRGIPTLTRAELLGQIMKNFRTAVAVSGTHGKTTTTSMISEILLCARLDPTISVGGVLPSIGGNIRVGSSDCFVTEACEYTNSFLSFYPTIGIILNIEEDHMDFFKDLEDIRSSFHRFALLLPSDGFLIVNGSIDRLPEITADINCPFVTFGKNDDCDYYCTDITYNELGHPSYILHDKSGQTAQVSLSVPGEHNVLNSLAAVALADRLCIDRSETLAGLAHFTGTDRRFQYKGCIGGVTVIDDYAHHPTEIRATLAAAEKYPHQRLWCVFQPHTYTRTRAFLKDFAQALSSADNIILTDIYAAREKNTIGISSKDLRDEIVRLGKACEYFPSFDEVENFLLKNISAGDLLITMGAGDVVNIGETLLGM